MTKNTNPIGGYFADVRQLAAEATTLKNTKAFSSGFTQFLGEVGAVGEGNTVTYGLPSGKMNFRLPTFMKFETKQNFGDNDVSNTGENGETGSTDDRNILDQVTGWFSKFVDTFTKSPEQLGEDIGISINTAPAEPIVINNAEGGVTTKAAIGSTTFIIIAIGMFMFFKRKK